jgi:hypothetical protein
VLVNRWIEEKTLWHACTDLRTGVQKKEKDRVLHENALNVQDPCIFGAALRLAALAAAGECEWVAEKIRAALRRPGTESTRLVMRVISVFPR